MGTFLRSIGPDQKWLRERLEELEKIDRPSASEGERRAAEWLVARFVELGAEARIEAERTVVVIAHHDPAHSGIVFHPRIPLIADRLGLLEKTDTSPMMMARILGGPLLAGLSALSGRRLLAKLGLVLGLGSVAAITDIGRREVVPGANDNGTAVVSLLALAQRLPRSHPPASA